MDLKKYLPVLFLFLSAVFIHILVEIFDASYYLTQLTMTCYYSLLAIGLCMLMGYAGQISLGQAGFFAIGGYSVAFFSTNNLLNFINVPAVKFFYKIGFLILNKSNFGQDVLVVSPWISFLLAIVITIIIAYLIGIPVLKLKGHYLAMATLGFCIIINRIILSSKELGEADGIIGIPAFNLFFNIKVSGDFSERIMNFYIVVLLLCLGLFLLINLINSRAGRALRSLHGGDAAANSMGINTFKYKLNIFVVSALFASVAGIFLTYYNSGIGPSEAGIDKSIRYVAIVAAGGAANLWGAFIASVILNFLSLRGVFGVYDDIVFGIILILTILFEPTGFIKKLFINNFDFLINLVKKKRA